MLQGLQFKSIKALENLKRISLILFVFLALARTSPASEGPGEAKVLTFETFCRKAVAYYPKLKQQDASVNAAIAKKLLAVSGFLPRVQGVTSVTHGDDPVFVFGSLLRENSFTSDNFELSKLNTPSPHTTYNFSLEAQWPIFDAFQTISRVRSAKFMIDSARFDKAFTQMEAYLVSSEAYLRAEALEKLLASVSEVSLDSQEDIKQAEDLKEKGLILGADFYSAKVILGNINQLKNQLTREKQAAHILLNILMGEDPFNAFEIQSEPVRGQAGNKTLESWLEEAYKLRPDFVAMDKTILAQQAEVSRERSTALPRVDAFMEARDDTHNFRSNGGRNYIAGVKAQIDLFDPAYPERVRISREALKKLELEKVLLKDNITKDLANEFAYYMSALDNLPLFQKMLEDAKQAVDLMLPLYREGRKSIADLLQIRFSYLNSAKGYYTLATDSRSSWMRLLFLSGQLDEARMNAVLKSKEE
ncbi:MAG: TolC family protein [Candidatus Omnitrophica bacterium]|nr:TolC family protein [Candidatus Omnitrophota bacterium]